MEKERKGRKFLTVNIMSSNLTADSRSIFVSNGDRDIINSKSVSQLY